MNDAAPAPRPRVAPALFRLAFVPALLGLWVLAWVHRGEGDVWLRGAGVPVDFTTAMLLVTVALIWLAEWAWPQNAEWHYHLLASGPRAVFSWGELLRDLVYLVFVTQLSALLIYAASSRLTPALASLGFGAGVPHLWPAQAPFVVKVLLAFLLVEFFSYWMHRAAHRVPLLWRFHSTHHVPSALSTLKALRTHPVDNLFFHVARSVPLLLLGAGAEELAAVVAFGGTLSLVSHANLSLTEGVLGLVVNFPSYHAVHHSLDLAESQSNFGCHTVLWDRVFRTFRQRATPPPALGIAPAGPRTMWQELVWPLYRSPH